MVEQTVTAHQFWTLCVEVVGVLGTWAAVLVALFGRSLCQMIFKPKLKLRVAEQFPYCMKLKKKNVTSSRFDFEVVEICGIVTNEKPFCAHRCKVMCLGIYVQDAAKTSFCEYKKIRPLQFQWIDFPFDKNEQAIDIAQSVENYVKLAEISKQEKLTSSGAPKGGASEDTTIAIAVSEYGNQECGYIRIPPENKSVVLKVQLSHAGNSPQHYNVRIDWQGRTVEEFGRLENLSVALIEDKNFKVKKV